MIHLVLIKAANFAKVLCFEGYTVVAPSSLSVLGGKGLISVSRALHVVLKCFNPLSTAGGDKGTRQDTDRHLQEGPGRCEGVKWVCHKQSQ